MTATANRDAGKVIELNELNSIGFKDFRSIWTEELEHGNKNFEGEILRKAANEKLRPYWYCLTLNQFYCYRKREDRNHKTM